MNGGNAIVRMLVLIAVTFVTMKVLVVAITKTRLTPRQWLAFAGWFGMRPALFTRRGAREAVPLTRGLAAIASGLALLVVARLIASPVVVFILALPALSLILHFGIIDVTTVLYAAPAGR